MDESEEEPRRVEDRKHQTGKYHPQSQLIWNPMVKGILFLFSFHVEFHGCNMTFFNDNHGDASNLNDRSRRLTSNVYI